MPRTPGRRGTRLPVAGLIALSSIVAVAVSGPFAAGRDQQPRAAHGRLFSPDKLSELEGPDREEWQEPDRIMDALGIFDGARVADVGAGGGWFTVRLARRVGPNGRVYAEDIQSQMIDSIARRVQGENLANVETKLGTPTNPHLPGNLDAIRVEGAGKASAARWTLTARKSSPGLSPGSCPTSNSTDCPSANSS